MNGINTLEINRLRQVHARTVAARRPGVRGPVQSSAAANNCSDDRNHTITRAPGLTNAPSKHTTVDRDTPQHNISGHNGNHPMCSHCGTMIIPSPVAKMPLMDTPSIKIDNWVIESCKRPICNAKELTDLERKLGLSTLPEMVFGNNFINIKNDKFNWGVEFNASSALGQVALEDTGIRVAYSKDWLQSKRQNANSVATGQDSSISEDSLNVIHNYDWTYTTPYKGTNMSSEGAEHQFIQDNNVKIPIELLCRPDRILYFDDMILFEDELADNGISILQCKIRVMHERLLLLNRFFLRVDDVLLRVIDTRVYVEFAQNKIIREWKWLEDSYDKIRSKCGIHRDPSALLRDSDWVAKHLTLKERQCEYIILE